MGLSNSSAWRNAAGYGFALACCAAATALQLGLERLTGSRDSVLCYFLAVTIVAWRTGLGPGLAAVGLSALLVIFFVIPPQNSWLIHSQVDLLLVLVFALSGGLIVIICESMHRQRRKVEMGSGMALAREAELMRAAGERLRAEFAEQEKEAELAAFFGVAGVGLALIAPQAGSFLRLNRRLAEMTGYSTEELLEMNYLELTHPDDRERTLTELRRMERGEIAMLHLEKRYVRRDHSVIWVEVTSTLLTSPNGEANRAVKVIQDITEQKEATRRQQAAERRKDEFLAMLSHELRNPLGAIRNALRVWSEQGDPDSLAWAKRVIDRQAAHLTRMVDDLLDVSRITGGKIRLNVKRIDLAAILEQSLESFHPMFAERQLTLHSEFTRGQLWVMADAERIEQMLSNLLTNAAKYSDPGASVFVSAGAENGQAVVRVRDTGHGMNPEQVADMFQLFVQGDRTLARSEGGLGLGLTIVKALAELHGGSVSGRSEGLGLGSEVGFTIPLTAPAEPPEKQELPYGASAGLAEIPPISILVVDDQEDAAEALGRLLRRRGCEVAIRHDGEAGLAAAREMQPRVILLDLGLPGLDGYEVAGHLRREGFRDTFIVAISGYGTEQNRQRSAEAGFDAHLLKPASFDEIWHLVAGAARLS